jgi:hypothetical protein
MTSAIAQMIKQNEVAATVTKQDAEVKAAAKKPRTVRAAQKPVKQIESVVAKSAPILAIKFDITCARPVAGRRLYAFTEAVLQLLGMYEGKRYPRAVLTKIMGATAIAYHTRNTCAIDSDASGDGYGLSTHGKENFFPMRKELGEVDADMVKKYQAILTTGKADSGDGALVPNQSVIKALTV